VLSSFQKHIEENFPNLREERFALACSGGIDSVVLAHLCNAMNLNFILLHCNFQLRGADSDDDEKFVSDLATTFEIPFFSTRFETKHYAQEQKLSIQMAARDLRYNWFAKLMKEQDVHVLVTGHQADDNLETFLINLSRGTGIRGLGGIPINTNNLARPLLAFTRNEIEIFASQNQIKWREDSSNSETKYLRNKIRHEVVPTLKELHPSFLEHFSQTQTHLTATIGIVDATIAKIKKDIFKDQGSVQSIEIKALQNLQPLNAYVYELFRAYGFTAWNDIAKLLTASSGKEVRSNTHRLVKDRTHLLLTAIAKPNEKSSFQIMANDTKVMTPINLFIEEVAQIGKQDENVLYVDKKTLKYPLGVRKWKNGDYFYPLGMQGKKKLSKYFKDEKVDVIAKDNQWLLCSDNDIVWVIGRRADNRFKVTETTKNIIKISLNK